MTTVTLNITGMTSDECATSIEQALNILPGIQAHVSYEQAIAKIEVSAEFDLLQIIEAVNDKGFGVSFPSANKKVHKL